MLDIHYSNITQKGKFGTIDSIKILSYRTNLTNITRQLYVLQPCPIKFPMERREGVLSSFATSPSPPSSRCLDDLKQRLDPSSSCRGGQDTLHDDLDKYLIESLTCLVLL